MEERIKELFGKYISDNIKTKEYQELKSFVGKMHDSELSEVLFNLWNENHYNTRHNDDFEQLVQKLKINPVGKSRRLILISHAAAAIAVLIIVTNSITWYLLSQHKHEHEPQVSEMVYEAHYGSRAFAILPDSSKVWLNSGSKLSVHQEYNFQERQVELIGEAYFEVKTNPEKPFIVKAGELSIKATGTTFNVKAYPEEGHITTTLVEGIVFIEGIDNQDKKFAIKMTPNQSVSYTRQDKNVETSVIAESETEQRTDKSLSSVPAIARQVKPETLTSWTKDRWIIDNDDFGSLAVKLERRYNVDIQFKSEELKDYRFTGIIERETLEEMFEVFRYTIPLKYTINKGVVTLTLDDKLQKQYEKAWKHQ